jgi:hypothetical protein
MAAAVRFAVEPLEERRLLTAPLPVTGVVARGVSASAIALKWDASVDPTVTGYNVIEKVWVPGGYKQQGHYDYNPKATNLNATADTVSGLVTGTFHTYLITAANSSGQSLFVLLSSGALWSSPVNVTAGLTSQVSLLISGNPLTYSVQSSPFSPTDPIPASDFPPALVTFVGPVAPSSPTASAARASGPPNLSINPRTGVITYTPGAADVGLVSATFKAGNALGSVTQTVQFNVSAGTPDLPKPALSLYSTSSTFNGGYQQVSATAVGADGVTPVSGYFTFALNGSTGYARNAGTYQVLAAFTSTDPSYGNATLLTNFTIDRATPAFYGLSAPTIAQFTATTALSGQVSVSSAAPGGEYVIVTAGGVSQAALVNTNGVFSTNFATSALPVGDYPITYSYAGDSNITAIIDNSSTLSVIPTAPPQVTLNPRNTITSAGDGVSFTANASGSPTPSVQWQFSSDGGTTWNNVTSNTSALTPTLIFTTTNTNMDGYRYRAVFTNPYGTATTSIAILTVEPGD